MLVTLIQHVKGTGDAMNVSKIDRDSLVDLRSVRVNTDLPKAQRMLDFSRQIKTPNCFKVGKYVVCLSFCENGLSAQEVFSELARSKAGG